ncbi:MAG: hypothetical protein AB1649_10645 [Chloroflexota bacterium]
MNKKLPKLIGGLVAALLLVGAAGAGIAYAQDDTTPTPTTDGQTDKGGPGRGHGHRFLGEAELQAAADALGMTTDEVSTALQSGKTLQDLADEAGVDLQVVQDAISAARAEEMRQRIEQAVADGTMTQEKADWLLEGLEKGFLDGPGFGLGFGHGHDGDRSSTDITATPTP